MSKQNKNSNLNKAKKVKNDEFYTQLNDIEKELVYYRNHFKNKIVYCNCDNPEWSNFYKYFKDNFKSLELKQLISTYYLSSIIKEDGTFIQPEVYKTVYDGVTEIKTKLIGNGDFRSYECIEILKKADIVVTNPPFSLFRNFVSILVEYKKNFLVIGSQNGVTCKEIFPLIKENKLWLGNNFVKEFRTPDREIQKFGNICWYTNLDIEKRHQKIILSKEYSKEEYLKYDNYDAINVNKVSEIPFNYNGVMGVPITFIDKYNPDQFEIIGNSSELAGAITINKKENKNPQRFYIDGKRLYDRILIKKKN